MRRVCLSILSLCALCAATSAQPAKLAWTRSDLSADLILKRANHVTVTKAGNVLVSGSAMMWDQHQACTVVMKRNRAVVDTFTKDMGDFGSTSFTVEIAGHGYLSVGRAIGEGSGDTLAFLQMLDYDLNLVAEKVFSATPEPGDEVPTDVAVDSAGNIYICGWGESGGLKKTWAYRTDTTLGILIGLLVPEAAATSKEDYQPTIAVNGIIAVLIGLMNGPTPEVRCVSPAGALNWTQGSLTDGEFTEATGFIDTWESASHFHWAGSWNSGSQSRAATRRLDMSTGAITESTVFPAVNGANSMRLADVGRSVWEQDPAAAAVAFIKGSTVNIDIVGSGGVQSTWESPANLSALNSTVMRDKFRESTVLNSYSWGLSQTATATKLSSSGAKRWEVPLGLMHQALVRNESIISHEESGDTFALQGAVNGFRLHCITQAPVAVTDTFRPRAGVLFRPALPVISNDRWAGGASITVVQPPAHGTLTMGANGFFNYTSTGGYLGVDSFKYRLTKPGVNTSTATVNLIVGN